MTHTHRTIFLMGLLSVLLPSLSQVGQAQDGAGLNVSGKTYTISGNAGLAHVRLEGLPDNVVTDTNGAYVARVEAGWSGHVTPTKAGYSFSPAFNEYEKVDEDYRNQDYTARIITFRVSGNAGVSGVTMRGLPGDPVTDEKGVYAAAVVSGWAGPVTPERAGYVFEPQRRVYPPVMADIRGQDYTAQVQMFTISDTIRMGNNEPIVGVKVTAEPGGVSVLTDSKGAYAIQVPYGWSGRLVFSKSGLEFEPNSKAFTIVTSDIIDGQPQPSSRWPNYPQSPPAPTYPRAVMPGVAGNVLVIPTTQVMPQKFAETAEDLRVMLQILREKLSEPRMVRGAFVDFGPFFDDRSRAFEAFYLQGAAVVFVLEIDSPLSFGPQPPGQGEATKEPVDPVWQRARQRLSGPQDPAMRGTRGLPDETGKMDFQQFKEDLLKTLRHAANVRNVEPNEAVILTVISHNESGWPTPASAGGSFSNRGGGWFEGGSYSTSSASFGPSGGNTYADSQIPYSRGSGTGAGRVNRVPGGSAPAAPTTVLTIQAKRADIDAFAKGGLNFEQFQQRVKTFTY